MAVGPASPDWIERLQDLVNETVERSTASTANLQRLLAAVAVPGVDPGTLATQLSSHGQDHGAEAYQRLVEVATRFFSRSMRLAARYRDEYLSELVPADRAAAAGPPPAVPSPPEGSSPTAWAAWYRLYAAWVTEQQAWSVQLYESLLREVASGALEADAVQTSARVFLQRRLPDYLADMAELNADLVADMLGVADRSVESLSDSLLGTRHADELVVQVSGAAGATTGAGLLIENTRPEPSLVSCDVSACAGFGLVTAPQQFQLGPGESRPVTIRVTLPPGATMGLVEAGSVTIRGQGDRDLRVLVLAVAEGGPESFTS